MPCRIVDYATVSTLTTYNMASIRRKMQVPDTYATFYMVNCNKQ